MVPTIKGSYGKQLINVLFGKANFRVPAKEGNEKGEGCCKLLRQPEERVNDIAMFPISARNVFGVVMRIETK